jgi:hypothetical protein
MDNELIKQPVLFKIDNAFFIKIDHEAIKLRDMSCFSDCIKCLLKSHYVFNLNYLDELRLIYGLFEKLMAIPCSVGTSAILSDFIRKVLK